MPEFISLRSFSLSSLTGHSAVFEAGVPKDIPAALVPYFGADSIRPEQG